MALCVNPSETYVKIKVPVDSEVNVIPKESCSCNHDHNKDGNHKNDNQHTDDNKANNHQENHKTPTPAGYENYILAEALLDIIAGDYEILERYVGKDLEYIEYEPLFDYATVDKKAYYVTCDNYVTLTDGTGVVHIAPAFGEDDSRIGRNYDLPFVQMIDGKGEFKAEARDFAGMFCRMQMSRL